MFPSPLPRYSPESAPRLLGETTGMKGATTSTNEIQSAETTTNQQDAFFTHTHPPGPRDHFTLPQHVSGSAPRFLHNDGREGRGRTPTDKIHTGEPAANLRGSALKNRRRGIVRISQGRSNPLPSTLRVPSSIRRLKTPSRSCHCRALTTFIISRCRSMSPQCCQASWPVARLPARVFDVTEAGIGTAAGPRQHHRVITHSAGGFRVRTGDTELVGPLPNLAWKGD